MSKLSIFVILLFPLVQTERKKVVTDENDPNPKHIHCLTPVVIVMFNLLLVGIQNEFE